MKSSCQLFSRQPDLTVPAPPFQRDHPNDRARFPSAANPHPFFASFAALTFCPQPSLMEKKKITITDVATEARVAVGTVSRVLNNHLDVNPSIRTRVWDAARALNYTRIRQRKNRASLDAVDPSQTATIAAIFFGMEDTLVQLPVVSSALQGIEGALSVHGRSLMLANIPNGDRVPPFLLGNQVAGLILKGPNQGELPRAESSELLQHIYRLPHVWLMGRLTNAKGDHCNFDTDTAGRLAADYLHAKGHRRLGFLNPKPGQTQFEKLKGALIAGASRHSSEVTVLETSPRDNLAWPLPAITAETTVRALVTRWASLAVEKRPTVLFVPSDRTAVQLYSVLSLMGIRVGIDVSVMSCNNERSLLANLHPTVATIDIHPEVIGAHAVDQLLWRIRHPQETLAVQVLVEPTLVEGASVAQV